MIEQSILSNLINNEQYFRKSIPFLKQDYFQDRSHKLAFKLIDDYVNGDKEDQKKKAYALALQHFDINTLKDKYLNVIQDVVG